MRVSRRAGLLKGGVRWLKYECSTSAGYTLSGFSYQGEGTMGETVWPSYGLDGSGTFYNKGTAYEIDGYTAGDTGYIASGSSLIRVVSNGDGTTKRYVARAVLYVSYNVGNYVCDIYAGEGERPEEKRGYQYQTTTGKYTVMRAPSGALYAYRKA
ncbi:MAG: hypothetical protein PUB51_00570 [Oscillospiraceae bacterium]|nr:hypothetical protein [Oscillospiraceae bacterium]